MPRRCTCDRGANTSPPTQTQNLVRIAAMRNGTGAEALCVAQDAARVLLPASSTARTRCCWSAWRMAQAAASD
jgi:hypothetical protein